MEEQMGRRTVGGLILTKAGSILIFRENNNNNNNNHINKDNSTYRSNKCCSRQGCGNSDNNNKNNRNKKLPEPSRRNPSSNTSTREGRTRGNSVNSVSRINRRIGSSNGLSRSTSVNLRASSSSSYSSSYSSVRNKSGNNKGVSGITRNRRGERERVSLARERREISLSSLDDESGYWHFNIENGSEQLLEHETSSILDEYSWPDRHREMRMDIDDMSYEELVAFCERIGTVSTGLTEEVLSECIERSYYLPNNSLSRILGTEEGDLKCIVCQEEYIIGEEIGKMKCKHYYHVNCIKQWLCQKNWCPICKSFASPSS